MTFIMVGRASPAADGGVSSAAELAFDALPEEFQVFDGVFFVALDLHRGKGVVKAGAFFAKKLDNGQRGFITRGCYKYAARIAADLPVPFSAGSLQRRA